MIKWIMSENASTLLKDSDTLKDLFTDENIRY